MNGRVRELLDRQSGVISRRQVIAAGLKPHDLQRLLRRREWVRVYDGVYVSHTGELSWLKRVGGRAVRGAHRPLRRLGDPSG